eukprot:superscaffoldBa00000016_g320
MQHIKAVGLKLNKEKCSLRQSQLRFLGHLIDKSGIQPDSDKVEAIHQLSPPCTIQELKRILGTVNYLGRYIPNLSTVEKPLHVLLKNKNTWNWGHSQQTAFEQIKELLTTAPVLSYYYYYVTKLQYQPMLAGVDWVACYSSFTESSGNLLHTAPYRSRNTLCPD